MKYQANLKTTRIGKEVCNVKIDCDDWKLYDRLVKIIEKEFDEYDER